LAVSKIESFDDLRDTLFTANFRSGVSVSEDLGCDIDMPSLNMFLSMMERYANPCLSSVSREGDRYKILHRLYSGGIYKQVVPDFSFLETAEGRLEEFEALANNIGPPARTIVQVRSFEVDYNKKIYHKVLIRDFNDGLILRLELDRALRRSLCRELSEPMTMLEYNFDELVIKDVKEGFHEYELESVVEVHHTPIIDKMALFMKARGDKSL